MKVYAYIHPELQILCCALLPEVVPPNVEAVVLEVESPDDVILDNGEVRLKTEAEKLQEEKRKKLAELKSYVTSLLEQTDYTIIKIAEVQAFRDADAVEQLRQKYAEKLQQREAIREWNEQIKKLIRNAKTLEELRSIEIRGWNK
jgi:hypothetical protein